MATKIPLALGNQAWDMMATAQQIDQCCGLGRGVNLLDNWYFADPINQRGQNSYSIPGYGIDRWACDSGVTLQDGFVSFMATFSQPLSLPEIKPLLGKTLTLSCLFMNGSLISGTSTLPSEFPSTATYFPFLNGNPGLFVYMDPAYNYAQLFRCSGGGNILAAKVELGTEQTLAVKNSSGNWVLADPPPNKALELLKCQRYYVKGTGDMPTGGNWILGHHVNGAGIVLEIPCRMRATPSLSVTTNRYYWNGVWVDVTLLGVAFSPLGVRIVYTQSPSISATIGASVLLEYAPDLSAEA